MTTDPKFHSYRPLFLSLIIGVLTLGLTTTTVVATTPNSASTTFDCTAVTAIPQSECAALVAIYNTMDGENWYNSLRPDPIYPRDTWLQVANPCAWYGVTCEAGHVRRLFFDLGGMSNTFPVESQNLTQLQTLALEYENVLPQDNYLPALTTLRLYNAQKIPASIGNLSALQEVDADGSAITSIDPAIGQLTNLQRLSLGISNLEEPIPAEFGALSALQELTLTRTSGITTPITLPTTFGNLGNLSKLTINGLVGSLPDTFGNLGNLELLDLGENQLQTLPENFGNLQKLRWLLLSGNQLNRLPDSIGNLSNLIFLDLAYNHLTALPSTIGNLTNMERLRLEYNQLQSLPAAIGSLVNLNTLELTDNQLTALPPEIGKLTKLIVLFLNQNHLSQLPPEISNSTALLDIRLSDNQLTELPATVDKLDAITALDLSRNHLSAYPATINGMANLETVWLNQNDLRFLPVGLTLPPKLKDLSLVGNQKLTGPIPASFTQLTQFKAPFFVGLCANDNAEFRQWLEEATGGESGNVRSCPALSVDVTEGAPGSHFTLVGTHFGFCCITSTVTVTVNSEVLGTFLVVDGAPFTATLTTTNTVTGRYLVSAAYGWPGWTYGYTPEVALTLAADAPLNSPTPASRQFALPPTAIYRNFIYLPHLAR